MGREHGREEPDQQEGANQDTADEGMSAPPEARGDARPPGFRGLRHFRRTPWNRVRPSGEISTPSNAVECTQAYAGCISGTVGASSA